MNIAYKRAKTSTLRIEKGASAVIAASRSSGTQSGFRSGYGYRPQGWIVTFCHVLHHLQVCAAPMASSYGRSCWCA